MRHVLLSGTQRALQDLKEATRKSRADGGTLLREASFSMRRSSKSGVQSTPS